jgi:hypothetical protein
VGRCKGWHLEIILFPNRIFFCWENKIFLGEEGRTCFQLKIGLSTEAASFLMLGVFTSSYASNDMLKRVENVLTVFEETLWKDVPKRSWVFRPAQISVWVFAKTELTS